MDNPRPGATHTPEFPRAPVDDAEREACDNYARASDWCGNRQTDQRFGGDGYGCTRRPHADGDHVAALHPSRGRLIAGRWPRASHPPAPEASATPETPRCDGGFPDYGSDVRGWGGKQLCEKCFRTRRDRHACTDYEGTNCIEQGDAMPCAACKARSADEVATATPDESGPITLTDWQVDRGPNEPEGAMQRLYLPEQVCAASVGPSDKDHDGCGDGWCYNVFDRASGDSIDDGHGLTLREALDGAEAALRSIGALASPPPREPAPTDEPKRSDNDQ